MSADKIHNPFRKLFISARNRKKSSQQDSLPESGSSESQSQESYQYDIEKAKLLAREDPLLPYLLASVKDWQLTHGSLIKLALHPATRHLSLAYTVLAQPIGVSIVPTIWPEERFQEAWKLQGILQNLYARIASDPEILFDIYKDCIVSEEGNGWHDEIVTALWKIHESVRDDPDGLGYVQDIDMSVCRGDWMLDVDVQSHQSKDVASLEDDPGMVSHASLKQVEFNAIATAGASHSTLVSRMHRQIFQTGIYDQISCASQIESTTHESLPRFPSSSKLAPVHDSVQAIALALATANQQYGNPKSRSAHRTAVLMLVQHDNVNIADERPIEYALWNMDPPVPCFRVEYREVMDQTWFQSALERLPPVGQDDPTGRELLFKPYNDNGAVFEVSVVYHRGSISMVELSDRPFPDAGSKTTGFDIRTHLERSRAIKCPSVLGQLASGKKVQQQFYSTPVMVENCVGDAAAHELREHSMPIYSLADPHGHLRQALDKAEPSKGGAQDYEMAKSNSEAAADALAAYVLKPVGAEGGGNCTFGAEIPAFYHEHIVSAGSQAGYLLQHRIHPPVVKGALMSPRGYHVGPVVSELGVLGTVTFRRPEGKARSSVTQQPSGERSDGFEVMSNETFGWTLKSKSQDVPEISVIKGYGCFDTPCLVDWMSYSQEATPSRKNWS